jgi:hypothetical protein
MQQTGRPVNSRRCFIALFIITNQDPLRIGMLRRQPELTPVKYPAKVKHLRPLENDMVDSKRKQAVTSAADSSGHGLSILTKRPSMSAGVDGSPKRVTPAVPVPASVSVTPTASHAAPSSEAKSNVNSSAAGIATVKTMSDSVSSASINNSSSSIAAVAAATGTSHLLPGIVVDTNPKDPSDADPTSCGYPRYVCFVFCVLVLFKVSSKTLISRPFCASLLDVPVPPFSLPSGISPADLPPHLTVNPGTSLSS